jgi:hypothetical protein
LWQPGQEPEKFKGAQLSVDQGGDDERSDVAFLDMEELDSLSSALAYLVEVGRQWSGQSREYVEVTYRSADDLTVGFYQQEKKQVPFINTGRGARVSAFFSSINDLSKLKSLSDSALVRLSEK